MCGLFTTTRDNSTLRSRYKTSQFRIEIVLFRSCNTNITLVNFYLFLSHLMRIAYSKKNTQKDKSDSMYVNITYSRYNDEIYSIADSFQFNRNTCKWTMECKFVSGNFTSQWERKYI